MITDAIATPEAGPAQVPGAGLVGREPELAFLDGRAQKLLAGRGAVVAVVGAAGTGKTALLREAVALVRRTVPSVRHVHIPGSRVAARTVPAIGRVLAGAVTGPVSPSARMLEELIDGETAASYPERHLLRSTLDIVRVATHQRPLLITIDDVELSHERVAEVFAPLAAGIVDLPVLVVVTAAAPPGQEQKMPPAGGGLWVHPLRPLVPAAAAAAVRFHSDVPVPISVARTIARLTGGNPGDAAQVCAMLTSEQLSGHSPLPAQLPGTDFSARLYRPWWATLPLEHRTLVLAAAVSVDAPLRVLERSCSALVSDVVGPDGDAALRCANNRVVPNDPRMASAVLALTPARELDRVHQALRGHAPEDSLEQSWHTACLAVEIHTADAESHPRTFRGIAEASRQRLEAGDALTALRLTEVASGLEATDAERYEFTMTAGVAAMYAGHPGEATRLLAHAVFAAKEHQLYRAVVPYLIALTLRDGAVPIAITDTAVAELQRTDARAAASVAALAARLCARHLDGANARARLEQAEVLVSRAEGEAENAGATAAPAEHAQLAMELAVTRGLVRGSAAPEATCRPLPALTGALPGTDVMGWALAVDTVAMLVRAGQWLRARTWLADLDFRSRGCQMPLVAAEVTVLGLQLHLSTWELHRAEQITDEIGEKPVHLPVGGVGLAHIARVLRLRGRVADAAAALDDAQHQARSHPETSAVARAVRHEYAERAAAGGHFQSVTEQFTDMLERSRLTGDARTAAHLGLLHARWHALECPSVEFAAAGAVRGSSGVFERLLLDVLGAPVEQVVATAAAAAAAACEHLFPGQAAGVLACAEARIAQLTPEQHGEQAARLAGAGAPIKRDAHRRLLLARTSELYLLSGAADLGAAADARSISFATPAADTSENVALTANELQIATLVRDGASNKEIASALYVSIRTVELRLTNVYRKLGIRSRKELRDLSPLHLAQPMPTSSSSRDGVTPIRCAAAAAPSPTPG
ncbi:AAA family ATPase [Georgenia sp. AZ-5]|uniref:helix-turn-helix transcriptional regulator n=1 Tax=Georgenia sp. AZ-5 TaxID=3367526 RepID=UPI00375506D4